MAASNPRARSSSNEEQFLRRAFDTAYEVTPENVRNTYVRIPRKVKWMIVSTLASLVLVIIAVQLTLAAVEAVQWANRPTLLERITDRYQLAQRPLPAVNSEGTAFYPLPYVDAALLRAERALALEEARAAADAAYMEALAIALAEAEAAGTTAEAVEAVADVAAVADAEDTAVEAAPEPVVLVDPAAFAIDEAAIIASIMPEVDQSYFRIMPRFQGFTRTYVYDDNPTHPALTCLVIIDEFAGGGCEMTHYPTFVEAADYTDAENMVVRIAAAQYETPEQARESLNEMRSHSFETSRLGDYALADGLAVNYFYSIAGRWNTFVWSNGTWVYAITAQSLTQVEHIIRGFPY
jgi:hypothetical protein